MYRVSKPQAMYFFVLAAISRGGLRSLYELQWRAGLQPGGILPLLKRLEREGLLERSEQRRRQRREMTVTTKGELILECQWQQCLRDYPDVESILRAAAVAILMGYRKQARSYLRCVADDHERNVPAGVDQPKAGKMSALEGYEFMRSAWETRRHQSAAALLREIAKELEDAKEFDDEQIN